VLFNEAFYYYFLTAFKARKNSLFIFDLVEKILKKLFFVERS